MFPHLRRKNTIIYQTSKKKLLNLKKIVENVTL